MKPPVFWSSPTPTPMATVLKPLGRYLARVTTRRRRGGKGYRSNLPVICCGNSTLGGAGKTPTALWLASILQQRGWQPYFLTRGWGGRHRGPHLVTLSSDTPTTVGDEALLLAQVAPTVVARHRAGGAQFIETMTNLQAAKQTPPLPPCIIMDDGYQHATLHKSRNILLFDRIAGIGNGLPFPAGPLREELPQSLDQASVIMIIGDPRASPQVSLWKSLFGHEPDGVNPTTTGTSPTPIPVFYPYFSLEVDHSTSPSNSRYVAFAGIGIPEKFFTALRSKGLTVVETITYGDHHLYTQKDIRRLTQAASNHRATLITTTKDYVRLPQGFRNNVKTASVTLHLAPKDIEKLLGHLNLR